jgi:hypothetical protein
VEAVFRGYHITFLGAGGLAGTTKKGVMLNVHGSP